MKPIDKFTLEDLGITQEQLDQGPDPRKLARKLDIPRETVKSILRHMKNREPKEK